MTFINTGNEPCQFYSLTRVGSGFTDTELAELDQKLQAHWNRVKPNEKPPRLQWTKEKPDLWIKPELSVILQVPQHRFRPKSGSSYWSALAQS